MHNLFTCLEEMVTPVFSKPKNEIKSIMKDIIGKYYSNILESDVNLKEYFVEFWKYSSKLLGKELPEDEINSLTGSFCDRKDNPYIFLTIFDKKLKISEYKDDKDLKQIIMDFKRKFYENKIKGSENNE